MRDDRRRRWKTIGEDMQCDFDEEHWADVIEPPFHVLDFGEFGSCISDNCGRTIMFEHRNVAFVDELCKVMNENKDRLVEAWKVKEQGEKGTGE